MNDREREEVRTISNTEGREAQAWMIGKTGENDDKVNWAA